MNDPYSTGSDAMADELRRIIEQAEELMGAAGVNNGSLGELKDRVNDTISAARAKLADLEVEARVRGRSAAAATESWVRANPWAALAIGAGVGIIVGALIMRGGTASDADEMDPNA